jgi:ribokinase
MPMNQKLLVVGSINMDIFTYVANHPKPGETLKSEKVLYSSGGKGANQAVAGALSGAEVYLLGAVGNDAFKETLLQSLKGYNVNTEHVIEKDTNSGLAFITVDQHGENHIVLSEGANGLIGKDDVEHALVKSILPGAILVQNEIAWEATQYAMEKAKMHNITIYYNAAPAQTIPDEVFKLIDVLIVNETEASTLTGIEMVKDDDVDSALYQLISNGINEVIITLGKKGSTYGNKAGERLITTGYQVEAVDTTAAGDTFVGAYISKRMKGSTVEMALRYATAASALTVTKHGAQISIPTESDIEAFLANF